MKTGRTLVDLAGELERQMSSKRDLVVLRISAHRGRHFRLIVDGISA